MKEKKEIEIICKLKERQAKMPCRQCGNNSSTLLDGYLNTSFQLDFKSFNLGSRSIPSVATVCTRCGFISVHALGVLELLPKDEGIRTMVENNKDHIRMIASGSAENSQ